MVRKKLSKDSRESRCGKMIVRIFFALSITTKWSIAEDIDWGTVVFANILFRHGDRTPVDPYPNDPYNNESLWPVPFGQLTNVGKHQHLLLGRWFRNRYGHFLPSHYTVHDIYVRSTDVDRTLMSAEANLAGLYPPEGDQVWDRLKWMPIPVHTAPQNEDNLLAAKKYCARYKYELEEVMSSDEMKRLNQRNAKLYAYLTENSGKGIASPQDVEYLYNTLFIENLNNMTLPDWTKAVFPEKMKPLAMESFKIPAYNKALQRLKSGPLLKEMVDHMVQKSKNALIPDRKIWMYSAHDVTVANVLMTLGVFQPHCPPYTATILIELRVNSKNQYIVTVSYKNSTADPIILTIPGCIAACPLPQFVKLLKDVIPEDWERECMLNWERYEYNKITGSIVVAILTSSVSVLVVLILAIVGLVYWNQRRDHGKYYLRLTTDPI